MKPYFATALTMAVACTAGAHTPETAIVAAMKLSEDRNYSWTCLVTDDAQSYVIEGKTRPDGLTWQRQPMAESVAKRLGRSAGRELEAIFRGPQHYVVQTEKGWRTLDELPKRHPDWNDGTWIYVSPPLGRTADQPADVREFDPFGHLPQAIFIPAHDPEDSARKPHSNAQFALALPHDELSVIVSSHSELKVEGDVATGMLTDLGARLLLVHDGHEYLQPVAAAGRFKLHLAGDRVSKYTIELGGIVLVHGKPVYVRQKATTEITNVGTTRFDLPRDALERLGNTIARNTR